MLRGRSSIARPGQGMEIEPRKRHPLLPASPRAAARLGCIAMNEWFAVSLLFATYAIALFASGAQPKVRPQRPHFDAILPRAKRPPLRLLHGALASHQ